MASLTINRSLCKICNKAPSVFYCPGCENDFCTTHAKEHRQDLSHKLDLIILEHDQLRQNVSECFDKPYYDHLIEEISQWETESILKIRQVAEDARNQILQFSNFHLGKITEELTELTKELTTARSEDNFIEFDLKDWKEQIEKYTNDLNKSSSINIRYEKDNLSFIEKLFVETTSDEYFEQSMGNLKIEDDRQVIRNESDGYSTARFHCDYSSGRHKYCFKIEQMNKKNWMLFGIVSKTSPIQNLSYNTPTNFAWITNGYVYLNGEGHSGYNGYKNDLQENDTVELLLDCNRRTIRLTNERTKNKYEINIDLDKCPFPWQVHVGLYYHNDKIRYLSF